MKYVAPVRKELGIRTVFNILGPLSQSGRCKHGADGRLRRGTGGAAGTGAWQTSAWNEAMVVYGQDGLDEISMSAPTTVCESQRTGSFLSYVMTPEQFGFTRCSKDGADRRKPPGQRADCTGDFKRGKRTQTGCGRSELRSGNPYRKGHFNRRCDQRSAGSHRQR